MPFGGTTSADDFETGTRGRGLRRHDLDRRLRHPVPRPDAAPRVGDVGEEGRRQGGHRLRLPHDHHRAERSGGGRDGRARPPGRHLVQAVHGLPRRLHARRREHFQGAAADGEERRHDLHARRERRRHRRARAAGARGGEDGAEVPRAHAAGARRSRSDAPRDRAGRDRGRADLHRPPVGGRGARDGHRSARPRAAGVRGNLPAVSVSVVRELRGARFRRREVRDEPAAARRGEAGRTCGAASPSTTCSASRPTTARSA